MALARGNSKTGGYKSRLLPISGKTIKSLGPRQKEVHEHAQSLIHIIQTFDKSLADALVLAAADGDGERKSKDHYKYTKKYRYGFDRFADSIFFSYLWLCVDNLDNDLVIAKHTFGFTTALWEKVQSIFASALDEIPCSNFYRPRAEARASSLFYSRIRKYFPELFTHELAKETSK